MSRRGTRIALIAVVLSPIVGTEIGRLIVSSTPSTRMTRTELTRDADLYRDSVGRQCGLNPLSLAHQEVRDGEITWLSLQNGRVVGFRFDGRTGKVFCGAG